MNDGEREIWDELQREAAPDFKEICVKTRRARKAHICSMCHKIIPSGDLYRVTVYLLDGVFHADKHHLACP